MKAYALYLFANLLGMFYLEQIAAGAICADISLRSLPIQRPRCADLMSKIGAMDVYLPSNDVLPDCISLKASTQLTTNSFQGTLSCACPYGYTDTNVRGLSQLSGEAQGIFYNITQYELNTITCVDPCKQPYNAILESKVSGICSCTNVQGCVFQERDLSSLEGGMRSAVLVLPDDIHQNTHVIECTQIQEGIPVSPKAILTCELAGISFIFLGQCPESCSYAGAACYTGENGHCAFACESGYFQHPSALSCQKCSTCDFNGAYLSGGRYIAQPCTPYADAVCVSCEDGKWIPNIFSNLQSCIDIENKTSALEIISNVTNICPEPLVYDTTTQGCVPCNRSSIWTQGACVLCPENTYRQDEDHVCIPCPPFQQRSLYGQECTGCAPGHMFVQGRCGKCPLNTISPSQRTLFCEQCADMHVSNIENTKCIPCPTGQTRRGNETTCGVCPLYHELRLLDGSCVPCSVSPNTICDNKNHFIDICGPTTHPSYTGLPCSCGCRECALAKAVDIHNSNYIFVQPCSLRCKGNMRMIKGHLSCIEYTDLVDDKSYIIDRGDPYATQAVSCLDVLNIPVNTISTHFHMYPCGVTLTKGLPIMSTVLRPFIRDRFTSFLRPDDCYFCCLDGHRMIGDHIDLVVGLGQCANITQNVDIISYTN